MKAIIWKLRAMYWFGRLADWYSWESATVLFDSFAEYGDSPYEWVPEDAVREELSCWGE